MSEEIVNAIIAGIGSADNASEQAIEIIINLERAGLSTRLIAAAPELLEELKTSYCPGDFTRTVEECMASRECGCSSGAAVAKATEPRP